MKTRYGLVAAGATAGLLLLAGYLAPLRAGVDAPPFSVTVPFDPYTVLIGPGAGAALQSGSSQNTLSGYQAGGAITTNTYNTLYGYFAGGNYTGGSSAHALNGFGAKACGSVTTGADNLCFGADAGNNDDGTGFITGADNIFDGTHSGGHVGSGSFNVATGNESMVGCGTWSGVPSCPLLTGSYNTADGHAALANIQGAAYENYAAGYQAGYELTTGFQNIFIGPYTGTNSVTTGSLNILIGRDMRVPSSTGSSQLNIGNLIQGTGLTQGGATSNGAVTIYGSLTTNAGLTVGGAASFGGNAITSAVWNGTSVGAAYGGTGSTASTAYVTQNGADEIDLVNESGSRIATLNTSAGANSCYPQLSAGGGTVASLSAQGTTCSGGGTLNLGTSGQNTAVLGSLSVAATVKTGGYTVSGLSGISSPSAGMRAYVTDATSCTFLGSLTGSGSNFCPVVYNGSAWVAG